MPIATMNAVRITIRVFQDRITNLIAYAHTSRPVDAGRARWRAPSATAKTAALTASIRPFDRALTSFALLEGSRIHTASARAERINSDGAAWTTPS
jgi:hypothetical protein